MLKRISLFAMLAIFIVSCSNDESKDVKSRKITEYLSAVIKGKEDVIAFGSIGINGILNKTAYKNEPMIDGLISTEVDKLKKVIDIDGPVYFSTEGPITKDGNPNRVLLFMRVKSAEKLAENLEKERSFLVEKVGDIQYAEDNEFVIGFRNDLAIVIIQHGNYDTKKIVADVFKKSQGDVCGGKIDEMLKRKGDLVVNIDVGHLYETSNTDLDKLSDDKKRRLSKMTKDSFVQSVLNFEKGGLSFEVKNYFSKELEDLMFFKTNDSSDLASKLAKGNGKVIGGISVNVDVKKMENFYSMYAPELLDNMNKEMKGMGGVFEFMGAGNIMSSLSSGEIGALAIGQDFGDTYEVGMRSFFGAPEAGQKVFSLMRSEMNLPEDGKFNYVDGGIEGLVPMNEASLQMFTTDTKLRMPKGSDNFGKSGLYAFVDFNEISRENFDSMEESVMNMLDYATFDYNNAGGKIYIKTKNNNDNILKQAMEFAMQSMLPMMMSGGMPF